MLRRRIWRADLVGRFEVGLKDGLLDVLCALVAAGVDVDGDERLGLVDDDVAAAGEPDLAVKGGVDLLLDAEAVEDRLRAGVVLDALPSRARKSGRPVRCMRSQALASSHDHCVDLIGEEVADGALDQVGLLEDAGGRRLLFDALLDVIPLFDSRMLRSRTK